ncbi:MAG: tRNA (adenosine(37)-N6)-dimethylallyltransferase MiaA [Deltaproteobacteria bacterium]|nr:tRNA (adenosine(37)-N6)-dimethylallyltransferase MiaA [Deltaproteobacteria bacterium]
MAIILSDKLRKAYNLIIVLGPTASGKTRIAVKLAKDLGSEIISADSRQVYRGLDIGTGKDLHEYTIDEESIPCHLIDIVDPGIEFNVFEYQKRFFDVFEQISRKGVVPVMVGGTGLYIEAVVSNYQMVQVPENIELREELMHETVDGLVNRLMEINPSVHNTTDLLDRKRLERAIEIAEFTKERKIGRVDQATTRPFIKPVLFGIHWRREVLRRRITERLRKRLRQGMIDEVKRLHDNGVSWDQFDFWGLEYRYISHYLQGKMTYNNMFNVLNTKIHQFAKRQETWFRRMEKKGSIIHWINGDDDESLQRTLFNIIDEIP